MNTHEIAIHYNPNADQVTEIVNALKAAGIEAQVKESGSRSVLVDPSEVGAAVEIINGLGYETDKDEPVRENSPAINGFYYSDSEYIAGDPQFVTRENYDAQYTAHVGNLGDEAFSRDEFDDQWQWITADDFEDERLRSNMRAELRFCYFPEITAFIEAQLAAYEVGD